VFSPLAVIFQEKDGRIKGKYRCDDKMERQETVINVKIKIKKKDTISSRM
jgi:hypothetical protein